jgi:hypothetical protein
MSLKGSLVLGRRGEIILEFTADDLSGMFNGIKLRRADHCGKQRERSFHHRYVDRRKAVIDDTLHARRPGHHLATLGIEKGSDLINGGFCVIRENVFHEVCNALSTNRVITRTSMNNDSNRFPESSGPV